MDMGQTSDVDSCPLCITEKKADRKIVGKLPYHVIEELLDKDAMARYSR